MRNVVKWIFRRHVYIKSTCMNHIHQVDSSVWQCARQCAIVWVAVCGSAVVCGCASGSVWQCAWQHCAALQEAVCSSAASCVAVAVCSSVQCVRQCATALCGSSVRCARQCAAVCAAVCVCLCSFFLLHSTTLNYLVYSIELKLRIQ
jgi:hypothetical protein